MEPARRPWNPYRRIGGMRCNIALHLAFSLIVVIVLWFSDLQHNKPNVNLNKTGIEKGVKARSQGLLQKQITCNVSNCQPNDEWFIVTDPKITVGMLTWTNVSSLINGTECVCNNDSMICHVNVSDDLDLNKDYWCFNSNNSEFHTPCRSPDHPKDRPARECPPTEKRRRRGLIEPENIALRMMVDYASHVNMSNCWICQHIPTSSRSPMLTSVPFSKADWEEYGWLPTPTEKDEDCFTNPTTVFTDEGQESDKQEVLWHIIKTFDQSFKDPSISSTVLFRLRYDRKVHRFWEELDIQMTLVQTNCSYETAGRVVPLTPLCKPIPFTPTVIVYARAEWRPQFRMIHILSLSHETIDCPASKSHRLRNCTQYWPTIPTYGLRNVSLCISNRVEKAKLQLGTSDCSEVSFTNFTAFGDLPEHVYLVCGDNAYSCIPPNAEGTCYMAYLVPLIRRVNQTEMGRLYQIPHRARRTLTLSQRIFSVLFPGYGVYSSQQEITALSSVLEKHMNTTAKAIVALGKELDETRAVALQNRLALDMILASQGGVCKIVKSECCTFISDASQEVLDLVKETKTGVKELHEVHGWDPIDGLSSVLGPLGWSIFRILAYVLAFVTFLIVGFMLISCLIKMCASRVTAQVLVQVPDARVTNWMNELPGNPFY
ncbi:hypothetical protein DPEC_G00096120 [Dallia pectoralis]|uniref:Uncharacterized protein n=1 Tax=Dallia pectoralis TaxID=75939 RepID=A0ACC2GVY3_DALPE|nr:hypothetical protein DPEC_G00096120 [Dallia pectoralis]